MKTVAIIQARMDSTRLQGKVMQNLAGSPMLIRVLNRVKRAKTLDEVVVATTGKPADEAIVALCTKYNWPYFRGSENDVLDRYYQAAVKYQAEVIVRITSDCPLIEPEIIDQVVQTFVNHQPDIDYVSNILSPRTFPRGLDTEVIRFGTLVRVWHEDHNPAWREHVTPYIYRNPDKFSLLNVTNDVDYSDMRWTVDTPEDLELIRRIYSHFQHDSFCWREVLTLLEQHPEWLKLNRDIQQKQIH